MRAWVAFEICFASSQPAALRSALVMMASLYVSSPLFRSLYSCSLISPAEKASSICFPILPKCSASCSSLMPKAVATSIFLSFSSMREDSFRAASETSALVNCVDSFGSHSFFHSLHGNCSILGGATDGAWPLISTTSRPGCRWEISTLTSAALCSSRVRCSSGITAGVCFGLAL